MQAHFIVAFLLLSAIGIRANDTEYEATGGELRPLKQVNIRMQYESLAFKISEYSATISVTYRFNNLGPDTTIQVAFVMPGIDAYDGEGMYSPGVTNFKASVNSIEVKTSEKRFKNGRVVKPKKSSEAKYAYVFTAAFHVGINTITHSYEQTTSNTVTSPYTRWVDYILTSGANWAGGIIDTIQITASPSENCVVSVRKIGELKDSINWKATNNSVELKHKKHKRHSYQEFWVNKGMITCSATNFAPRKEIKIAFADLRSLMSDEMYGEEYGTTEQHLKSVADKINSWDKPPKDFIKLLLEARKESDSDPQDSVATMLKKMLNK